MRTFHGLLLCFGLLSTTACGEDEAATPPHVARTGGSVVALSRDERLAVVTYRAAGVVEVLLLKPERGIPNMVTRSTVIDVGEGSEPWAAAIGADDDTAYVVLRGARQVVRISALRHGPVLDDDQRVDVGAEPMGIAITPTGQKLFVSNWADGTLSMILTNDLAAGAQSISLNGSLTSLGILGEIAPRSGLAHPRALAISDDGDQDDFDETLYATEFFSQPLEDVPESPDFGELDRNRQGLVYTVDLHSGNPGDPISIAPVENTGFDDSKGPTSCFPNQLSAAALDNGRLYVTGMCTSPRGPLGPGKPETPTPGNFKALFHPAVFVIDSETQRELPGEGRLLTRVLQNYYDGGESDVAARMPLTPNDIAFRTWSDGRHSAYVSALGADAIYQLDYDSTGSMLGIGSPGARYIDTKSVHGLLNGLAVSRGKRTFAIGVNDGTQQLSLVNLASGEVTVASNLSNLEQARAVLDSPENQGHRFFATGRDIWSFKGQAWSSCEGCHPGGLSDGITWFFQRGPRRTLSTANTFDKAPRVEERGQRLLLWGANGDEVHDVEGITRRVSGGIGGVLWTYVDEDAATNECRLLYDGSAPAAASVEPCGMSKTTTTLNHGLNGSLGEVVRGNACRFADATCQGTNARDWNDIEAFVRGLRPPRAAPSRSSDEAELIEAGRKLFVTGNCAACHGGPGWTVSTLFYQPGAASNGALPYVAEAAKPALGSLRETSYVVPAELRDLNPATMATGEASFRLAKPAETPYTADAQGDDQIQCALRDVGTFPAFPDAIRPLGIVAQGAPPVVELRQDMTTLAQGANGFNVPSLFGLAVGAPYFHAGNARTLEELFDQEAFGRHYQRLAPADFLAVPITRVDQVAALVAYLNSIDDTTAIEPVPSAMYDFCHQ